MYSRYKIVSRAKRQQFGKRVDALKEALGDLVSQHLVQSYARHMNAFYESCAEDLERVASETRGRVEASLHSHGGKAVHDIVASLAGGEVMRRLRQAASAGPPAQKSGGGRSGRRSGTRADAPAGQAERDIIARLITPPRDVDLDLVHRTALRCAGPADACRSSPASVAAVRARMRELAKAITDSIRDGGGVYRFNQRTREYLNSRAGAAEPAGDLAALDVQELVYFGLKNAHNMTIDVDPDDPELTLVVEHVAPAEPEPLPGQKKAHALDCDNANFRPGLAPDPPLPSSSSPSLRKTAVRSAAACHAMRESINVTIDVDAPLSASGDDAAPSVIPARTHLMRLTLMCLVKWRTRAGAVLAAVVPVNFLDVSIPQTGDALYGGRAALSPAEFRDLGCELPGTPLRSATVPMLACEAVATLARVRHGMAVAESSGAAEGGPATRALHQDAIAKGKEHFIKQARKVRLRIAGLAAIHALSRGLPAPTGAALVEDVPWISLAPKYAAASATGGAGGRGRPRSRGGGGGGSRSSKAVDSPHVALRRKLAADYAAVLDDVVREHAAEIAAIMARLRGLKVAL
jgi:hypothetical protein